MPDPHATPDRATSKRVRDEDVIYEALISDDGFMQLTQHTGSLE